jgi:two-component system sensor histidine kinase/response regulator
LVVEDNKLNQEITVGMLKLMGIKPTIACNGQKAVDLCRAQPFDLLLMDIQMPVMDGLEATRQIRNGTDRMRDVPIIAMTASALYTDRRSKAWKQA